MVSTLPTLCVRRRLRLEELPSDNGTGLEHDFQIKQDRPVFEIEQIHRDHLVERRFVCAAYLPVSGQARQTVYAFSLPWLIMSKFIWRTGPRTNQTHCTAMYIENLRQFIQTDATQKSSERGQARCAASLPRVRLPRAQHSSRCGSGGPGCRPWSLARHPGDDLLSSSCEFLHCCYPAKSQELIVREETTFSFSVY